MCARPGVSELQTSLVLPLTALALSGHLQNLVFNLDQGCLHCRLASVLPSTASSYSRGVGKKIMRVMGQKLFVATTTGVELLHRRLLQGPVDYFDTCMHELTLAGKVQRSEFPLAGSREHYSLVNGGKMLAEEIPERKD